MLQLFDHGEELPAGIFRLDCDFYRPVFCFHSRPGIVFLSREIFFSPLVEYVVFVFGSCWCSVINLLSWPTFFSYFNLTIGVLEVHLLHILVMGLVDSLK